MRTDQEKLAAVRELIQSWKFELAQIENPGKRHYDQDREERESIIAQCLYSGIDELEQAVADEQDTAAPNRDSAEPGTGASS